MKTVCVCGHPHDEHIWESLNGQFRSASSCWHRDMEEMPGSWQLIECRCEKYASLANISRMETMQQASG